MFHLAYIYKSKICIEIEKEELILVDCHLTFNIYINDTGIKIILQVFDLYEYGVYINRH